jgi:iron(III) transport system ATP-binding protein
MVFQSYAIWPHMTVFDNVAFPLTHGTRKQPKNVVKEKVMRALGLVQLEHLAQRPAPLLSGGQQQRVALARALAHEPTVLLLDEPLSNLDAKLREDMRHEIKNLVHRLDATTLYVTHDQLEALSMSDTVALMRDGVVVQEGHPRDVYLEPATPFVANFLGRTNLLDGTIGRAAAEPNGTGVVETQFGNLLCPLPGWATAGAAVNIGFRPESIVLSGSPPAESDNVLRGTVASSLFSGDAVEYQVDLGGKTIRVKGEPFAMFKDGQTVFARVPTERCYVLSALGAGQAEPVAMAV